MFVKKVVHATKAEELFSVREKVVLISGVGGLGSCLARGFLDNGAYVVMADNAPDRAAALKEGFAKEGLSRCDAYQMDQTSKAQIQAVVDDIVTKHGRVDVLFNTAALCWNEDTEEFKEDGIRTMIDVNLTSAILLTQVVGKAMIARKEGKIIEIGSIGGLECHSFRSMPYEATKAAVHQLTKSFATAWAQYNINVNCIAPTWINTPLVDFAAGAVRKAVIDQHFFGRMAEVEDFLGAAIFLASDASNYISGHVLAVDGAWSVSKPWKVEGVTP
ncbi:gluconate 5-dehydrogenase [Oscillospiraceae bacterium]|nr:gluconate 5-dehydrogenase [Oscillospiraceae bacterium]BDF73731.1 gluconate 5-dehydrogenase [Oscillospiraceae bacterium]